MGDWIAFTPQGGTPGAMMPNLLFLGALAVAVWLRWVAVRTGFPVYCFLVSLGTGVACGFAGGMPAGPAVLVASLAVCGGILWRYGLPWRPRADGVARGRGPA